MPKSPRLRSKLLFLFALVALFSQGAVPFGDPHARAIGKQLMCKCGCNATITECNMINCHFADPVREKITAGVAAGKSDEAILDDFKQQYGLSIFVKPPAEGFFLSAWVMPFVGAGLGLGVVALVIRKYYGKKPAAETAAPASPELAKFQAEIEKELKELE
jgi:cytochrome c-type biogenesis protein CcmH/NrfF